MTRNEKTALWLMFLGLCGIALCIPAGLFSLTAFGVLLISGLTLAALGALVATLDTLLR